MPQPPEEGRAAHRDRYFEWHGARLRYRDDGRGPPLLLLHGWTLDLDMWNPQVAALAGRFRILRLDRRGHGLSSGQPGLTEDVADAAALCRQLDADRIGLVGMSQGARVAQALAREYPALVACVVLDGPPGMPPDVPFERYRELARTTGLDSVRHEWARHPLTQLKSGDAQARTLVARMLARYPGKDLLDQLPTASATLPTGQPRQPTLIVNGALDVESRRRSGDALAVSVPQARRELIAGAGHLPNLDAPAAYNALLDEFFTHHLSLGG